MKLAERQALFFRAARGVGTRDSLDAAFVGRGALSGADRLRVYNHAYFARLEAALADIYPVTREALGEARFVEIARRYVMTVPAPHAEIERVGASFPAFLAQRDGRRALADLAELEWARVAALIAAHSEVVYNLPALEPDALASQRLDWVASLTVHTVLASASRAFREQRAAALAIETADVSTLAIWRKGLRVEHRSLDADEASLLARNRSPTLHEICNHFATADDPAQRAFAVLRRWLSAGWVSAFEGT